MANGARLRSLEFYVNSDVWNEGGSLTAAHMRFFVDDSGTGRRIDYDTPEPVREMIVSLGTDWARKFLDYAAGTLRAPAWSDMLVDAGENVKSFPGTKPLHEDKHGDFADYGLYRTDRVGADGPLWSLRLVTEDGEEREMAFHHRMHDEPQALLWALMELFEPDRDWLDDDE